MDRREALKKMAVGGATVVGASVVLSNVAFADGGTVNSRPTGIAGGSVSFLPATTTSKNTRTVAATLTAIPAGLCPYGTPSTPRREYAWSLVPGTEIGASISGTTFSTTLSTQTISSLNVLNGTFTVRLTIRWVCDQQPTGATAAWRCRSFTLVITTDTSGANGTVTPSTNTVTTEDGTAVNCQAVPNPPLPS